MRIDLHGARLRVSRGQHRLGGDARHGNAALRVGIGHAEFEIGIGVVSEQAHLVHCLRGLRLLHLPGPVGAEQQQRQAGLARLHHGGQPVTWRGAAGGEHHARLAAGAAWPRAKKAATRSSCNTVHGS